MTASGSNLTSSGPEAFWEITIEHRAHCRRLLNHHSWRDHRSPLLPFDFLLALLVGCALPCGDFVQGAPLRSHPHMGVAREHGKMKQSTLSPELRGPARYCQFPPLDRLETWVSN